MQLLAKQGSVYAEHFKVCIWWVTSILINLVVFQSFIWLSPLSRPLPTPRGSCIIHSCDSQCSLSCYTSILLKLLFEFHAFNNCRYLQHICTLSYTFLWRIFNVVVTVCKMQKKVWLDRWSLLNPYKMLSIHEKQFVFIQVPLPQHQHTFLCWYWIKGTCIMITQQERTCSFSLYMDFSFHDHRHNFWIWIIRVRHCQVNWLLMINRRFRTVFWLGHRITKGDRSSSFGYVTPQSNIQWHGKNLASNPAPPGSLSYWVPGDPVR